MTGYTHRIAPCPITARSPKDDPPPAERSSGSGNQIVMQPPSPRSKSPLALSPSPVYPPQPTFPRSRSPHHSSLSLEIPVSRPTPRGYEEEQNRASAPQPKLVVETERRCPSCHHIFYTLGEGEFQSHVAGCFK